MNAKPEDREAWHTSLYAPLPGEDPDKVGEAVIEDEMSAFMNLSQEVGRYG